MAAGSIIIEFLMRTGSFETDTARAAKSLRTLQKEAEATSRAFKASFAGNLVADLAQKFGSFLGQLPGQVLADVDAFNDLKDATGASIENISALDRVARETGGTFETVQSSLIKLNQALTKADLGSDAERALTKLGLSVKELKALDPALAFQKIAVAMEGFAVDGDKARIAQILFGKSLKEVAPLLKDVAEKGSLVATTTTDQAEAVEAYRKQSFRLKADIDDLGRSILINLIPHLISATQQIKELFGAKEGNETLNKRIVNALLDVENEAARLAKGDGMFDVLLYGTKATREKNLADAKKRLADARAAYQSLFSTSTAGAGRGGDFRPPIGDLGIKDKKAGAAKTDPFDALIKSAREMLAVSKLALEAEDDLTEAQKFGARVAADLAAGTLKITDSQLQLLTVTLDQADAAQKANEAKKLSAKLDEDAAKENEKFVDSQRDKLQNLRDEAAVAKEQLAVFGLTREAVEKRAIALERDKAARLSEQARQAELNFQDKNATLFRQQADAINEAADARDRLLSSQVELDTDPLKGAAQGVKDYLEEIAKAGLATAEIVKTSVQSIEEIGADALQGKNIKAKAKALVDQLIQEFFRLQIIRPLMQSILGDGSGAASGIGSLFSGASSGGFFSNLAKAFGGFAGLFADGGFIPPGKFGLVGERGPELALGGRSGKTIVPMNETGSRAKVYTINVAMPPGAMRDSATAMQRGREFGVGIRQALARND